jgi:hypothetical protein
MTTTRLPRITEDPAWLAAKQVHADYADQVATINADQRLSDVGRAERVAKARGDANALIQRHADDLNARRAARIADLQSRLPVGPEIPDDASPADQTVMHAGFRQTLGDARDTAPEHLPAKLAEAEKYGDTTAIRGIMTNALEDPRRRATVDAYAANHPEVAEALNELPTITTSGDDFFTRQFERQVFHPVGTSALSTSDNF